MEKIFNLPPLKESHEIQSGHEIPIPREAGIWIPDTNASFLEKIANCLQVQNLNPSYSEVVSIPDVWAQIDVFKSALFDNKHPLHTQAVNEWRGFLALFGLSLYHDLPISTNEIKISSIKDKHNSFIEVLLKSKPTEKLSNLHDWDELAIILYNEKPIGMIVPTTLISPGSEYYKAFETPTQWHYEDNERFIWDPCKSSKLSQAEFKALAFYVDGLIKSIAEESEKIYDEIFEDILSSLQGLLKSYLKDLNRKIVDANNDWQKSFEKVTNTEISIPPKKFYQSLKLVPVMSDEEARKCESDTILKPRKEITEQLSVIIIDPELEQVLGRPANNITIWTTYTLDLINNLVDKKQNHKLDELAKKMNNENYATIYSDAFFTKHFFRLKDGKVLHHPKGFEEYILPLTPLALFFFSPEELKKNLLIRNLPEKNSVEVSLRMFLTSTDGKKERYHYKKVYSNDNDEGKIVEINKPTTTVIWPDFIFDEWKNYYVYHSGRISNQIFYLNPFSASIAKDTIESMKTSDIIKNLKNNVNIENLSNIKKIELNDHPEDYKELLWFQTLPEAMICNASKSVLEEDIQFYDSDEKEIAGLLLFPVLNKITKKSNNYIVGIDFGTTNTCIFWKKEDSSYINKMEFSSRTKSFFEIQNTTEKLLLETELEQELIPTQNSNSMKIPFLTLLMDRDIYEKYHQMKNNERIPLLSTRIYFVEEIERALKDACSNERSVHFGLKWDITREAKERIEYFLSQLALQSLAELATKGISPNNVKWRFSYPAAFTQERLVNFKRCFQGAIQNVIDPKRKSHVQAPEMRLESLASALYFQDTNKGYFTQSVITLDIGGGTSDISIWQSEKLIWQSSVKLAGQDILIKFLSKRKEAVRYFKVADDISIKNIPIEKEKAALEIIVNNKRFREKLEEDFSVISEEELIKEMGLLSEFCIAGILYYIGSLLVHLNSKNKFDLDIPLSTLSVCICGRGSLIIKRFIYDNQDKVEKLKLLLKQTSGFKGEVKIEFSDSPKTEVAYGLLVDGYINKNDIKGQAEKSEVYPLENMYEGGVLLNDAQPPDINNLNNEWKVEELKVTQFFIDKYINIFKHKIPFNNKIIRAILDKVNDQLNQKREQLQKDSESYADKSLMKIEPLFTIVLRELIHYYAEHGIKGMKGKTSRASTKKISYPNGKTIEVLLNKYHQCINSGDIDNFISDYKVKFVELSNLRDRGIQSTIPPEFNYPVDESNSQFWLIYLNDEKVNILIPAYQIYKSKSALTSSGGRGSAKWFTSIYEIKQGNSYEILKPAIFDEKNKKISKSGKMLLPIK